MSNLPNTATSETQKVRVHELAKEAGTPSKVALNLLPVLGYRSPGSEKLKSASSALYLMPCERRALARSIQIEQFMQEFGL